MIRDAFSHLKCVYVLLCVSITTTLFSQGKVKGRIIDDNGEFLIGVTISPLENPSLGTTTDYDGNYELTLKSGEKHTLEYSYIGYDKIIREVTLADNEILDLNITMGASAVELNEVEIVAKKDKRANYYMEGVKKKSITTLDYMSGDLMKKLGDSNVASAISRVTGVSTNGSFITVRGIGDRYVKTSINGSIIPTLDPFTNNIKLDLFPSSLVDNIVITKTLSPNLPGDWSAAYISIETKDFPDKLSIGINSSIGYNPQVSFQDVLANKTSSTDWLGYDTDFRDIDHSNFMPVDASPSQYDIMVALGMGDYYRSIGVTEPWLPGTKQGELYYKLGLIEMGLLGKGHIDNADKVAQAKNAFASGSYLNDAYRIINAGAEKFNSSLANNWTVFTKQAPLNYSQSFTIGNRLSFLGMDLGFLGGFRYGSTTTFDPNSQLNRVILNALDDAGNPVVEQQFNQEIVKYSNGWTGLVNLNLKINPEHKVSLLFMPNQKGSNQIRNGLDILGSSTYPEAYALSQFYEQRTQYVTQVKTEHYLPTLKTKWTNTASYTDGKSNAPDFKNLNYFSEGGLFLFDKSVSNIRRNFRYLDENLFDAKTSLDISIGEGSKRVSKLQVGASLIYHTREFQQFDYRLIPNFGVGFDIPEGDLDQFFTDEKFAFSTPDRNSQIDLFYARADDPANHTYGQNMIYGTYVKWDQGITDRLRISTGLRGEWTDLFTDVKEFLDGDYPADDLRRQSQGIAFVLEPGVKKEFNLLPSINAIYTLNSDNLNPMNIRLNYSRSIARPSLREFSETIIEDFELNSGVFGNAQLDIVKVNNFDFRFEKYFPSGDNIFVSTFYKTFYNHIELLNSILGFTWSNADFSYVYGVEIEGKKNIIEGLDFRSNISLVNSYTKVDDLMLTLENGIKKWETIGVKERTMFGQAPYIINAILDYSLSNIGFSTSISYNFQGPKLILASIGGPPDVYEMPRHLLNVKVSKSINKYFKASLTVRNLLNAPIRRSYKYGEEYLLDFDKFRYGTDFNLSISYTL